jgi:sulfur-oxidizing protein SoxA
MKKITTALMILGFALALPMGAQASPESDLKEFQGYFKKKFPNVKFEDFSNGLYALPGAEDRRAEWEGLMDFPPYELELASAKKFWDKNDLGSCFKNGGKNIAQGFPYWDAKSKKVITIEGAINSCLASKKLPQIKDVQKGQMAQLAAYFKSMSAGQKVELDLSDSGMRAVYEQGKKFYWAKRGQLNFSCADCHVSNSGKFVGGNILSAGLGHGVGFPAYRSKWGGLGTLHRRYGGCNRQVRAKSLKPQGPEYTALEVYETYMATGLPLVAPSQRF